MTASPKQQLQQLVDLQKIDDQISEKRKIIADIPRQLDSARNELEEKKNILKVVMDEIETLKREHRAMLTELEAATAKTKPVGAVPTTTPAKGELGTEEKMT